MPINRSIAINALLPSFLPSVSEETNMTPDIKQATNTTRVHSTHLFGQIDGLNGP